MVTLLPSTQARKHTRQVTKTLGWTIVSQMQQTFVSGSIQSSELHSGQTIVYKETRGRKTYFSASSNLYNIITAKSLVILCRVLTFLLSFLNDHHLSPYTHHNTGKQQKTHSWYYEWENRYCKDENGLLIMQGWWRTNADGERKWRECRFKAEEEKSLVVRVGVSSMLFALFLSR